jgi:acyl carrier protein
LSRPVVSEADIRVWCLDYLGRNFADASLAGDPDASFAELGLDSVHAAHFIVELEEWLGVELDPELIYEHPTVADLARHVFARHFAGDSGDARPD